MNKLIRIRVAGVLPEKGKVLLACHEKNDQQYWLLPGGGVDYGESVEGALKREFLEETNLRIQVGKLLIISESIAPDGSRHGLHLIFLVKRLSGKLRASPDERLRFTQFMTWEKLPKLLFLPNLARMLLRLRKKKFAGEPEFTGNIWIPLSE